MKKKSLTMNAIMSGVRSILSILFPLITFPYVSRVLQVENLGKYNFANSVCSYFVLLAGLGISTYAIREGSKLRENREQISRFAFQMYTINLASSALSYLVLLLVAPAVTGLICLSRDVVLLISDPSYLPASTSLQILSAALFVCLFGWLYNACVLIPQKREKYVMYATVVSALVNILFNLILVPLFQENAAAFTTVLAEAVSMVLCIFYARGLVDLKVNLRSVGSVLVGCAGIVACCTAARYAIDGFLPRVAVSVFGSCAVYFLILALLKNEMVRDVLQKAAARLRAGG